MKTNIYSMAHNFEIRTFAVNLFVIPSYRVLEFDNTQVENPITYLVFENRYSQRENCHFSKILTLI